MDMRLVLGSALMFLSAVTFAVAPGSATDTNTLDFSCVGSFGGASAVLVGPDLVLSARHVSGSEVTFPGLGTFPVVSGAMFAHPTDDLRLFRINTGSTVLNNYAQINIDPVAAGTSVTMVGFGGSGVLNSAGNGYALTIPAGTRRKASAIVEGTVFVDEPGLRLSSIYAPLRASGQGALVGGDSGGGWFLQGSFARPQLVGINSWIGTFGAGVGNWQFSSDPNNFFASGAADLSAYRTWLSGNGVSVVPEPSAVLAVSFGITALSRKRRKSV